MNYVGAHVSTAGGVENAPANANAIGATAFALFVKNPRQWNAAPLSDASAVAFRHAMKLERYTADQVVPHAGYLINLGAPVAEMYTKSYDAFLDEMNRCEALGLTCLNVHPGGHAGENTVDNSVVRIADAINRALNVTKNVTVILENTAGQGSSVGHLFEELAAIIDKVDDKTRIGICIDTCHAFAAGYDIATAPGWKKTMQQIDDTIGLTYLKAMHLNDSKKGLASRVDRHDSLGKGMLGLEVFKTLMKDKRLDKIPLILETIDESIWPQEIELLMSFSR